MAKSHNSESTVRGFILQLRDNGYTAQQIIAVANEILDFVINDLKQQVPPAAGLESDGTHKGQ
ncbi:hypothetical protein JRI60_11370 [Archangium violaceum]|uniref:hypothetical protein n=1 Tax=Archangium violaceum TaxID=83451 RepID=UPI001951328B|nr:hypothetical protein [Archangium violaceum]QRN99573.1 hypothetical protein JRI60_11370 [Archangium violaceum]